MRHVVIIVAFLTALLAQPAVAQTQPQRLALLIGNKAYTAKVGALRNPHSDVDLVGAALTKLGFKVVALKDATYKQMDSALKRHASDVRKAGSGTLSFFYYSGHGVANPDTQLNYLIPVDVADADDDKIWFESMQQSLIIDTLSRQAPAATHYLVFDACRNELSLTGSAAKSIGAEKGFVPVADTSGLLIAYATAPKRTASDAGDGGGPYAKILAEELVRPGVESVSMFRAVQIRVKQAIGQDPWLSFPSLPPVYLAGNSPSATLAPAQPPPLTYPRYVEAFEAGQPILRDQAFTREEMGRFAFSVLDSSIAKLKGTRWQGGIGWSNVTFDATGQRATYTNDETGASAAAPGRLLLTGVFGDAGNYQGGTRSAAIEPILIGEWYQSNGSGGFILKFERERLKLLWGPRFLRESVWQPASVTSAPAASATAPTGQSAPPTGNLGDAARVCREVEGMTSLALLAVLERQHQGTPAGACVAARVTEIKDAQVAALKQAEKDAKEKAAAEAETRRTAVVAAEAKKAADELRPGRVFRDCPECPEMVVVPAGSFTMGSPESEPERSNNENPQRRVTFARAFAVGKFEVTFAEWDACVSGGGCKHRPDDGNWGRGRQPVLNVSWNDAREYIAWLSRQTGKTYRLLSEAEWEYAARAGTTTRFAFGNSLSNKQAQFSEGTFGDAKRPVQVGSFAANGFGIHDMHGNVWEWCEDTWHFGYAGAPNDGSVWQGGDTTFRIARGGSWYVNSSYLRSGHRGVNSPDKRDDNIGFRVARTL